jgi:hypothetical protein
MSPSAAAKATDQPQDEPKALARELWDLLKPIASKEANWNPKTWDAHNAWLWREEILDGAHEAMPGLKPDRIRKAIKAAKGKI